MAWTVSVPELRPTGEAGHEARLEHGDGRICLAGAAAVDHPASAPGAKAPGVFGQTGAESDLLALPDPSRLGVPWRRGMTVVRTLDLRTGVLRQEIADGEASAEVTSFCCLARPGVYALRAEGDPSLLGEAPPLRAPSPADPAEAASEEPPAEGRPQVMTVTGETGAGVAAGAQRRDGRRLDRVAAFAVDPLDLPERSEAIERLAAAQEAGFDALRAEQGEAWARRWEGCEVSIGGDPELEHAVRFALFHLQGLVAAEGEAAVGARGTTGAAYRGHVFWDADVFVLPFFAATHPAAARAMLRYRARRLPVASRAARGLGRHGARFPWESAATGEDVTPTSMLDGQGEVVRVLTGRLEEHITADVAWAAAHYLAWTGDEEFARGEGLALLVQTARYWASRAERDGDGRCHVRHVIGPDEYHENVDDSAYTNVMARWNLRAAAAHAERFGDGGLRADAVRWRQVADALVDGYDPATGLYEEFSGFFDLEPVVAAELGERPLSGPALVGYEATHGSQLVKQTDVLLLHLNVPGEVAPCSLEANLSFYEPRTTHESSLSAGSTAEALARAGRADEALSWLRQGAFLDLIERPPAGRAGLHTAALGNTWRALAYGFMGLRPDAGVLRVDPRLPSSWEALDLRVRHRGTAVRLSASDSGVTVATEGPLVVAFRDEPPVTLAPGETRLGDG